MASYLSELLSAIGIMALSALSMILLYLAGSIAAFFIFYIKESIQNTDRPPIAGTVFHQLIYFDRVFDFHASIARKHQTFRLLKPLRSEIFTTNPANIQHILKTNFSKYTKGEVSQSLLMDLLGDGIFTVDGEKWRHQRKLASFEFSTRVIRDISSVVFRTNAVKLAKKIEDVASTAALFDMEDLLMKTAMDSIFKVGFGVDINSLSEFDDFGARFSKAFDDSNQIVCRRFFDVFWTLKRYLNIGFEAQLKRNVKEINDFVFQLIRHKREQMKMETDNKRKEDILSRFIIASEDDPEMITDKYLRDITLNFLVAGRDTSASTLTWFFYMLCKHPLVEEKIITEIRDVIGLEGMGTNIEVFASSLTEQILDKMQYLHAALTETIRLYPVVPLNGRISVEDDVLPDGFKVKKGDGVNYPIYAMGRMTYLWGEDAEDFRPERWLKDGYFRPESPFKFTAFNAGPRICLGKEFAYKQMKILSIVLLYCFKFRLGDEKKTAAYKTMLTFHIDKGLPLIAFRRSC